MYDQNDKKYCYTLEDTVRGYGIKDKGNTAIPHNENEVSYYLRVRNSPKYGNVVVVFTERDDDLYTLKGGGISFQQILCHGGNDYGDTEGCILVNANRDITKMLANGSQKDQILKDVQNLLDQGYDVRLRVINLPQLS